MARKVTVTLVDDTDESKTAAETLEFGLDGVSYEIDLSEENARRLRGALERYVSAARPTPGPARARRPKPQTAPTRTGTIRSDGQPQAVIRAWARREGMEVNDRGRLSAEVVAAFHEAHR
ncbi:histone-like nucleoid-structuring protein Lsr2 [Tsukamurella hominis]|uniref:histone-like nucleoid-structuring protein Lsr2 n=1 Tax=Tsukamurella hominis TaxID=1970232 RepID=UPI0039EC3D2F